MFFLVVAAGFLVTAAGFLVAPGALAAFSILFNLQNKRYKLFKSGVFFLSEGTFSPTSR